MNWVDGPVGRVEMVSEGKKNVTLIASLEKQICCLKGCSINVIQIRGKQQAVQAVVVLHMPVWY